MKFKESFKKQLDEGKTGWMGYFCDNIGGGFKGAGDISMEYRKDKLMIKPYLYSGSSHVEHVFKLSKDIQDTLKLRNREVSDAEEKIDTLSSDIQMGVAKLISEELAKFDKAVGAGIKKLMPKYLK